MAAIGLIESFDGRLRDGHLNVNEFASLERAQTMPQCWQDDCNLQRPHGALGHLTPSKYVNRGRS
ncbi:MAG: hypothetical protein A3G25_05505 [Betaproteobacteria bacterium RIFCSPLOWO2_12_FULL_63_13]|nr:MAG: hypothetical protein A3H32_11545 [Betaproteobacteria bacterium RIFCSPLOWO2_02_FULL_63_19]OGA43091.1 MAG: hypothetical protein A3G25_05505 [Betaproteobacteria bacterium RIFCSPLOWO2_12_FULL_63_13]